MTETTVGLIGIGSLFLLMILRMPVAFAMLVVGFFGYGWLEGTRSATALLCS